MKYNVYNDIYVKSKNSVHRIKSRYNIAITLFLLLMIIVNSILGNTSDILLLFKSIIVSFISSSLIQYVINIFKKEYSFIKMYENDDIYAISLILALFAYRLDIYVLALAVVISLLVKNIFDKLNISASLYGITFLLLYRYYVLNIESPLIILHNNGINYDNMININYGVMNYLFGFEYLSPILSISGYIYLFYNKSIKYNLVLSYMLTVFILFLGYGIFNEMNIWITIFELFTGSIIFLSIFILTDYKISPTISEGNILYGIILGIITAILRIIIPELAVVISFIIGQIIIFRLIQRFSFNFKYNRRLYYGVIVSLMLIGITSMIIISILL